MLMKLEQSRGPLIGFRACGALTDYDYEHFLIPEVNRVLAEEEAIALLFEMEGFAGWEMRALWKDLTFGLEINRRVRRIALVGDQEWERWVARLVRIFAHGEVRYFPMPRRDEAWRWLQDAFALPASS